MKLNWTPNTFSDFAICHFSVTCNCEWSTKVAAVRRESFASLAVAQNE
jgi:hypothetical protein